MHMCKTHQTTQALASTIDITTKAYNFIQCFAYSARTYILVYGIGKGETVASFNPINLKTPYSTYI
jgi:hypothetical protein